MTPRVCICESEADRFESEGFTLTAEHLRIQCAGGKSHIIGGSFSQMSEHATASISRMAMDESAGQEG